MHNPMKHLTDLSPQACRRLSCILLDIDDTLTTDGHLEPAAYAALARLREAGLRVVPVTGRPAGWCDLIARFWPVDGVVGENGAFYFRYENATRSMKRRYATTEADRRENRARLDTIAAQVLAAVPGSALSADQPFRIADLAIDFCEDVPALPKAEIDRIVAIFQAAGAVAKVSSIHVNGWFGSYDKLGMARIMLQNEFGISQIDAGSNVLYVGDSPNDEPMFAAFPLSVGVANVADYLDRIRDLPQFVTQGRSGNGFVELTNYLLAARS